MEQLASRKDGTGRGAGAADAGSAARPVAGASAAAGRASARPSVISLTIKDKGALYAAYMRFVEGGGLFIPTTRPAQLGDEIYAILTLMDEPGKVPVPGKVCWVTPAGVPGRQQGLGIQFAKNEAGEEARNKIETLIGGVLNSARTTHTI
jgi:type IV pilus assembly protein PilZ